MIMAKKTTEVINPEDVEILSNDERGSDFGMASEKAAQVIEQAVKTAGQTLNVTDEMRAYSDIIPNNGFAFREQLIREAKDMSTQEKLAASRENDAFEVQKAKQVNEIANEIRNNKTVNTIEIIVMVAIAVGVPVAAIHPVSRKILIETAKKAGKYALKK